MREQAHRLMTAIRETEPQQEYGKYIHRKEALPIFAKLLEALIRNKKIVLHGDYDADGFFSSLAMHNYLNYLSYVLNTGTPRIDYSFSSRSDGYTLPEKKFRRLQKKYDLIVFFDTGSSYPYLDETVTDTIVIDHHPPTRGALPSYVFNPGADGTLSTSNGRVVYELIGIMDREIARKKPGYRNLIEPLIRAYAAITLVSDMAMLDRDNRDFIRDGLDALNGLRWAYFTDKISRYRIRYLDLSFNIINKINSQSRMNRNFEEIADLFLFDFSNGKIKNRLPAAEYDQRWDTIETVHNERKEVLNEAHIDAGKFLLETEGDTRPNIILYRHEGEYDGINGLIAQYIFEKTGINAVSYSFNEARGEFVGSGRGHQIKKALEAIYALTPNFHFGGHAKASGLSFSPSMEKELLWGAAAINEEHDPELHRADEIHIPIVMPLNVNETLAVARQYAKACRGVPFEQKLYAMLEEFDVIDHKKTETNWEFALLGDPDSERGGLQIGYRSGQKRLDGQEPVLVEIFSAGQAGTIFLQNRPPVTQSAEEYLERTEKEMTVTEPEEIPVVEIEDFQTITI